MRKFSWLLGAVLATRVKDLIVANLAALGPDGAQAARALQGGSGTSVLDVGSLPPQLAGRMTKQIFSRLDDGQVKEVSCVADTGNNGNALPFGQLLNL